VLRTDRFGPAAFAGVAQFARTILDGVVSVTIAPECVSCGSSLQHPLGGPVCASCWSAIRIISGPVCDRCGTPVAQLRSRALVPFRDRSARHAIRGAGRVPEPTESHSVGLRCGRCRQKPGSVARGRAVGPYEGVLRDVIHAFKYDKRRSLGRALGDLLCAQGHEMIAGADFAVPVPLHRRRRRTRGFDQAADLAARLPLPVRRVLRRARATPPQVDLPATRRYRNVAGAFQLRSYVRVGRCRWQASRPLLTGAVVVLVDDVSTTGATLDACAAVLKAGGAAEVRALTVARTLGIVG
jgi:ComF family protein